MRPVLTFRVLPIDLANVRFVDEGRRLKGVTLTLASHVSFGYPVHLGIDDRRQLFQSSGIAVTPSSKDLGQFL
jgi:hypothetical protein